MKLPLLLLVLIITEFGTAHSSNSSLTTPAIHGSNMEKSGLKENELRYGGQCVGGVNIGGQCLIFSQEELNWDNAVVACASAGGRLASLADTDAVLAYTIGKYGDDVPFWIGGSDSANEGTWVWMTGDPVQELQWQGDNPNSYGGNQDCLSVTYKGGYDDGTCSLTVRYICEKGVIPKECEVNGGKCLSKQHTNCKGTINTEYECGQKEVCCMKEINQCVIEDEENSVLWNKIDSSEIAIKETVNENNTHIRSELRTILERLDAISLIVNETSSRNDTQETCNTGLYLKELDFKNLDGQTGETSNYYTSASNISEAFKNGYYWHSGVPTMPQAIWLHFDQPFKVVIYSFKSRSVDQENLTPDGPSKYEFFGSNATDCSDQSSWVVLKQDLSGTPFTPMYGFRTEYVTHPDFYTCYGIKVLDVPGRSAGPKWVTIADIHFLY